MSGDNHERERSPQQSQRPGSGGARRSVFGSSSNIFSHRPNPIQSSASPADIKNSAPSISDAAGSEKEKNGAANIEKSVEDENDSSRKEAQKQKDESIAQLASSNQISESATDKTSTPEKSGNGFSTTGDAPDSSVVKPKSSTSFASYLSNVKKRKQELADQEKKNKEIQDGIAQNLSQSEHNDKTNKSEAGVKNELSQDPIRNLNTDTTVNVADENTEAVKPISVKEVFTDTPKLDVNVKSIDEDSSKDKMDVDTETLNNKQNVDKVETDTKLPTGKKGESDNEHIVSPVSALSSELSVLPSSTSTEKHISQPIHIPPRIPESEDSDADITATPRRDTNVAEDSDAETVHGDSPPKPRRGRLIRKSDMDPDTSDRKLDLSEQEDIDSYHKKLRLERLDRRSQSKSSSPQRQNTKKTRAGRDSSGRLKLQRACDKGKLEQAKQLIQEGADVNDQDYAGNSALHEAALKGFTDIVKLLLENGAHVDIRSGPDDLDTPLIDAAANGHRTTVEVLLQHGADPRIQNAHGQNALDSLDEDDEDTPYLKSILREATLTLKSKGKTHSHNNSDADDQSFDEDRSHSRSKSRNHTQRRGPRNDLLLVDFTTRNGRDEVYSRASDGDVQFVGTYLENGGKPDHQALALAAKFGHTDVVNLFLAFGAKVDLADERGLTPLMQTVGRGHIDTVKLLLQAGADPTKRSKDNKSVLDFATDSLVSEDEEIRLIRDSLAKMGAASSTIDSRASEIKPKKKRVISGDDSYESHDVKKKKSSKHSESTSSTLAKQKQNHLDQERKKEKLKEERHRENDAEREREHERDRLKSQEIIARPVESKFSNAKPESMKRTHSNGGSVVEPSEKPLVKAPKVEHVETEAEKHARLEREKEEQKKREEFEALRAAKRKAREQEFLSNFETEEKKKEEELKKLAELQAERKLKEAQENEYRAKLEAEKKLIMSQNEEIEKRRQIREHYPYGLQTATFDGQRSKEEVLPYLPLYHMDIKGTQYCSDLQVIMILGIEKFYERYESLKSSKIDIDEKEKRALFNYFYPFLGNFSFKSTSKQVENFQVELQKFLQLNVNWIKYDDVLKIIKDDFESINDVVVTRTLELDINGRKETTELISPKIEEGSNSRKASNSVNDSAKNLPFALRHRPGFVKVLSKNKKLW